MKNVHGLKAGCPAFNAMLEESREKMYTVYFPRIPSMKNRVLEFEEARRNKVRLAQRKGLGCTTSSDTPKDFYKPRTELSDEAKTRTK